MTDQELKIMREEIAFVMKTTVNGKIDQIDRKLTEHNEKHEKDFERMVPIIEAYESGQQDLKTATKAGKFVLWMAATVTAIGGAYLVVRMIFFNH